jgi:hypothetical protein
VCGLLGFPPSGELGPAVISRIGAEPEITMKMLILAAIRCSLMFTVVAAVSFVHLAQAHLVTLEQVGSDVVATGIGAINLTGLTSVGGGNAGSCVIRASGGEIATGLSIRCCSIGQRDLEQRDFRQPRRDARHLCMDVRDGTSGRELHARARSC